MRRSYNIYGVDQLAIVDAAVPDPNLLRLVLLFLPFEYGVVPTVVVGRTREKS